MKSDEGRELAGRNRLGAALAAGIGVVPVSGVAAAPGSELAAGQTASAVGQGLERAVVDRDAYGVPSIYARSMAGVWCGAGYAQAQDRMVQLELTRRAVEGDLSELFCPKPRC